MSAARRRMVSGLALRREVGLAEAAGARRGAREGQRDGFQRRQDARAALFGRRWQAPEFGRRRRQEEGWRRRRGCVVRSFEDDLRPVDDHVFFLGRRRQALEIVRVEARRRFERDRKTGETAARVVEMRPARIAPHIAPIGVGRIGQNGAVPGQGLASRRENRSHAIGQRVRRIGLQESLIGRERVDLDGRGIGLVGVRKIADRTRLQCAVALRRRQGLGIGVGREQDDRMRQFRCVPRHQGTMRQFIGTQTRPREGFIDRHASIAQHLGQSARINAIGALLGRCDRAGRCVEGNERALFGFDERKAACERIALYRKRIGTRRIEYEDARVQWQSAERVESNP